MTWGVFGAALAFRAAYLAWAGGRVWFDVPALDAQIFDGWARTILAGDWVGRRLFLLNPGYAYVLAFLYGIAGPGPWAPAIAQALVGAVTAVLVARIGESCGGRSAGWGAGLLYALTACLPFYETQRLSAAWLNLANAAGLYWLLVPGRPAGLKAGLALGASAWFRPNVLPVAVAVVMATWRWLRAGASPAPTTATSYECTRLVLRVAAGIALALAPLVIRNLVVSHEFVLTTVAGGIVFYKGNAPGPGLYTVPEFSSNNPSVEAEEFRREAMRRTGHALSVAGASRFWTVETVRAVRADPGGWIRRMGRKAVALLHADEPSTNLDYDTFSRGAPIRLSPVTFGWLWVLAALGILWGGKAPGVRLLTVYVAAYAVLLLALIAAPEYRLPLAPALAVLAGLGLVEAPRRWVATGGFPRALVFGAAGLALIALHRPVFAPRESQARVLLGRMYLDQGDPAAALNEWDAAVRLGVPSESLAPWRARARVVADRIAANRIAGPFRPGRPGP